MIMKARNLRTEANVVEPVERKQISRRALLRATGFGVASGVAGTSLLTEYVDWLQVERHTLRLPKWDADGFKVAILTDIHVNNDRMTERAVAAAKLAVEERPDLIVVLGDYINYVVPGTADRIVRALDPLRKAKCPCIGIMGNHDYWSRKPDEVMIAIGETPVWLLRNEVKELDGVSIVGLDDALVDRHRPDCFSAAKVSKSCLVLLHEPDAVVDIPDHASIQLSGHSHGGQICLPGGKPIKPPPMGSVFTAGFYPNAPVPLYVSRGVGTTGPDYRLFCRPEVSVLTLNGV